MRPLSPRSRQVLSILVCAAVLPACGGSEGPTEPSGGSPGPVTTVEVTPAADTLSALDQMQQLRATALDADGDEVTGINFTWSSSDASVASVDDGGVVTALGNGATEISATASGVTGTAEVAVLQRVEAVSVSPATATLTTVGATQQFTASATDANGNPVEGAVFVWDSEDPTVATVDPNGLMTSKGSGTSAITATSQDIPGQADVTVNQEIDRLAFRENPTDAVAGEAIDPAVQVEVLDAGGSVVKNAEIGITLSLGANPGGASLAGTKTVRAVSGVATFSGLWVDAAAAGYTLAASTPGTVTGAESTAFDISAGPAAKLAFTGQPTDGTAGEAIAPEIEVEVQDRFGNLVPSASNSVTVGLAEGPDDATLLGTTTVSASSGVATFGDLKIEKASGGYALRAETEGLEAGSSAPFEIGAAAADHLAFTDGVALHANSVVEETVEVAVRDPFGNLVTTAANDVTLTLEDPASGTNPFGGTLSGTVTQSAVTGVASFDDLSVDIVGTYGLNASSTGLTTGSVTAFVFVEFVAVSAGSFHTCAITVTEDMHCWGRGDDGQLGNGSTDTEVHSPRLVRGGHAWASLSAADTHTCGVTTNQDIFCWGDAGEGKLGNSETTGTFSTPQPVTSPEDFFAVSAGNSHTCAVTTPDGGAFCWGNAANGRLGNATNTGSFATPQAVSTGQAFFDITAGSAHTCARTGSGIVYCWGSASSGRLGNGTDTGEFSTPQEVSIPAGLGSQVAYDGLDAGAAHTCAIRADDDAVYCWGAGVDGRLGDGATANNLVPDRVIGGQRFRSLSAGGDHTCAVSDDGRTYCWGANDAGQLGNGSTASQTAPMLVSDLGQLSETAMSAAEITAGDLHSCALSETTGFCWGSGSFGRLGTGTSTLEEFFPVEVFLSVTR